MRAQPIRFTNLVPLSCRASLFQGTTPSLSGLFIYSINRSATYFPCLLFQTRYGTNCFGHQAREAGARSVFSTGHGPEVFLRTATNSVTRRCILHTFERLGQPDVSVVKSCPHATKSRSLAFNRIGRAESPNVRALTTDGSNSGPLEHSYRR